MPKVPASYFVFVFLQGDSPVVMTILFFKAVTLKFNCCWFIEITPIFFSLQGNTRYIHRRISPPLQCLNPLLARAIHPQVHGCVYCLQVVWFSSQQNPRQAMHSYMFLLLKLIFLCLIYASISCCRDRYISRFHEKPTSLRVMTFVTQAFEQGRGKSNPCLATDSRISPTS
jgi:hypothetical protein